MGKMRLRYWIFLNFLLLIINKTLSAKIIRSEDIVSDDEPLFVPPHRALDSTSTTTKVTRKEPWVHPDHASHVFTIPDCDHIEGGDSECDNSENATQHFYQYDYVTDDRIGDIYDYGVPTTTANPEGLEEMDFVYGDIPILNRKVVNARRANVLEHPYVVNIARNYSHYLVGTLVSKNIVITVAHPLYGVPIYELGVLVGESYLDRRSNGLMTVLLLIFHGQFNFRTLENNIVAIRFMAENVKSYTCLVKPISLLNPSNKIEGKTAFITGWGRCDSSLAWCVPRTSRYYFGEVMDTMMRTASFTYRASPPPKACQWYADNGLPLSSEMMCLGPSREEDPEAPCLGAPGAPLVVDGCLVAVLAWGAGCGYYTDKPLIYTRVSDYVLWLQLVVTKLGSIHSPVMYPFYQATQNFIRKEYLYENRMFQPLKIVNPASDTLSMIPTEFDTIVAGDIDEMDVTVYDIRDFIDNGRFHAHKQRLYASLNSGDKSAMVGHAPPPPSPLDAVTPMPTTFPESSTYEGKGDGKHHFSDYYLDDNNYYYR